MAVKKKWYQIVAPDMFGNKIIGETLIADPRHLIGRTVETSLMELTSDFSRYHIKMKFKITDVDGDKANTEFVGHDILKEQIYRIVRRRTKRVDSIETLQTKDGKVIRIKTIAVISRRVKTSIKNEVRRKMSDMIHETVHKKNLTEVIDMIIKGELQNMLKKELKKVYPINAVEIRKSEVINRLKKKHAARIRKKAETVKNSEENHQKKAAKKR